MDGPLDMWPHLVAALVLEVAQRQLLPLQALQWKAATPKGE
jgi:hypothetical protein